MPSLNELKKMHDIIINCIEVMGGKRIPEDCQCLANCQHVARKILMHSLAIGKLLEGTYVTNVNDVEYHVLDFPSMGALSRSLLESYLLFNYIFIKKKENEDKNFYHEIWRLGGLLDRQQFIATSQEAIDTRIRELSDIESIREYIKKHKIYTILTKTEKSQALKGKWRTGKHWVDIAEETGIHNQLFKMLYSYLSAHVHSGYLSVLQISQAFTKEIQERLSVIYIHICLIVGSHFVISYCNLFSDVKLYLNKNKDDLEFIERTYVTSSQFEEMISSNKIAR